MSQHEHTISRGFYIFIGLCLMVLTAVTVWAAFINLGPLNPVIALGIATLKAVLVVLFFMHAKYTSERMTKVVIVAGIFWLFILLALSLADYMTRLWG